MKLARAHLLLSGLLLYAAGCAREHQQNGADSETFGDRFFYGGVAIGPAYFQRSGENRLLLWFGVERA